MEIGELLINLGFKADTTKLRDFIHDVGDLNLASVFATTGLAGVVDGIKDIMQVADAAARSLNIFQSLTGLSAKDLQQWDQVAQESGIAAGEMGTAINGLQDKIENLKLTGEGAAFFGFLGIDPTKMTDTFTSLKMILNAIKDMDIAKQKFVLTKFGLPENLVQMIPNLDKINAITTNTAEDLGSMREFMVQITDLSSDWKKLMIEIGAIIEKSFVGDMLRGLDIMIKFLSHWQLLIPILTVATYLIGQMAALAIITSLANPVTAPFAVGALAVGGTLLGATLLGALSKNNDNGGTNVDMTNHISITGDSAENNISEMKKFMSNSIQTAKDQQPFYSV